jgi:voltage-gated potassium channel
MEFTLTFIQLFALFIYLALPILFFLCVVVIVLGQWVGRIEKWSRFNALYWSFITALTVGYGDVRPLTKTSKSLSVFIALVGIMFTGILVAITVNAASICFEKHNDINAIKEYIEETIDQDPS